MDLFNGCTLEEALTEIARQNCNEKIGQVVKFVFGIMGSAAPFTAESILVKATWDALIAAEDETKIVVTNYITNVVIPPTDVIEEGGETNINRMEEMIDGSNAKATFNPRGIAAAIRTQMQALIPHSAIQPGISQLGVMMINADGEVICDSVDFWFNAHNLFIGDSDVIAEKGKSNSTIGKFTLPFGWTRNLKKYKPNFKILNTYPVAA